MPKAETTKDYTEITNPYDTFLLRNVEITENKDVNGNVESMSVKSDGAIGDIWIKNFIRSENWKPRKMGFSIDGQTGEAEFSNVFISGEIRALSGLIGGFTIGETDLSVTSGGNTTIISSGATAFSAGPTGSPTTTITQAGELTVTSGTITGATIQTAATGKRLRMKGSPANEYQFLDDDVSLGSLKIDDDGAGGYSAKIIIDFLGGPSGGAVLEVGSFLGASEGIFFSAPFVSTSGKASTGAAYFYGGTDGTSAAGIIWWGGGDGTWSFDMNSTQVLISSDITPISGMTKSLGDAAHYWDYAYINRPVFNNPVINNILYLDELAANTVNAISFNSTLRNYWGVADPSSGQADTNGCMYYNTVTHELRIKKNGTWQSITTS